MQQFEFNTDMPEEKRTQRHISTVILSLFGGVEAQASISKDGTKIILSTNQNKVNAQIRKELSSEIYNEQNINWLKDKSSDLLQKEEFHKLSYKKAMKNRVIRHALKLQSELSDINLIKSDGSIIIPKNVLAKLGDRHAEIRIQQTKGWNIKTYNNPSGTKYPCMGCMLYFQSNKIDIGSEMGPMWLTTSALSTQLEPELNKKEKIGNLSKPKKISKRIYDQYSKLEDKITMGEGLHRDGESNIDYDADSMSDIDEEYFESMKEKLTPHNSGNSNKKRKQIEQKKQTKNSKTTLNSDDEKEEKESKKKLIKKRKNNK